MTDLFGLFLRPLENAGFEYMIIAKLEYYREGQSEKHLTDIRSILRQPEFQDLRESADIQNWVKKLGVVELWDENFH